MRSPRLCLAAAILGVLACSGDASGPTVEFPTVVGTWNLVSVEGRSLPIPFGLQEFQSEQLVISADGSFTDSYVVRNLSGGVPSQILHKGTWLMNTINTFALHYNGVEDPLFPTTGIVAENQLTVSFGPRGGSWAWVFNRRQ